MSCFAMYYIRGSEKHEDRENDRDLIEEMHQLAEELQNDKLEFIKNMNSNFTVNIEEEMHNEKDWFGWWHWS